ncbi:biotin--[acetyl-CoA-carboxylase] ligase [Winogradskyella sp. 3972H.M.0a.05]|uniref:biotin--[acetyl-CoA-carboxylase] ligase n=1 Tax=Winogradskyella sp. 3972H.M.0a.05 TaxID=2950277 RepID=UPI0033910C5D
MQIIKLDAIDSTNTYLRQLSVAKALKDFTVVSAQYQKEGRGQMGTTWQSQPSKNLMFSVFKDVSFLKVNQNYAISMVVALALMKTLKLFSIKKVQIKWPNDILSEQKKVGGILIENILKQNTLKASIIGVGLNVNQTEFTDLPQASSLRLISGKNHDLDEILFAFIQQLKEGFQNMKAQSFLDLKRDYETNLFRKNKPSTFKDAEGNTFTGIIKGVTDSGRLRVLVEDDIIKEYEHKTITLLY